MATWVDGAHDDSRSSLLSTFMAYRRSNHTSRLKFKSHRIHFHSPSNRFEDKRSQNLFFLLPCVFFTLVSTSFVFNSKSSLKLGEKFEIFHIEMSSNCSIYSLRSNFSIQHRFHERFSHPQCRLDPRHVRSGSSLDLRAPAKRLQIVSFSCICHFRILRWCLSLMELSMLLLLSCIHRVLVSTFAYQENATRAVEYIIRVDFVHEIKYFLPFNCEFEKWRKLIWFFSSHPQPLPASVWHSANHHQRISANHSGERRSVVAGQESRCRYNARRAITEVPGVPRLAAEDPLSAWERQDRQLTATAAKHDRGHLNASVFNLFKHLREVFLLIFPPTRGFSAPFAIFILTFFPSTSYVSFLGVSMEPTLRLNETQIIWCNQDW